MGKYYLFSDFSEESGLSLVEDDFKRELKDYKKIVFIASNPDIGMVTDKYVERYMEWFDRIGINFESKVVLDNRLENRAMVEAIDRASLIYLMGGTTDLQMKFLLDNDLVKSLREVQCLIMGLSAGAINMAETSILTVTCEHEKQEIYNGIGLVDESVEPHFSLDNFSEELKSLSYDHLIYGMCDESAIIIRDDKCNYYGEIYLLKDGKAEKVSMI
ncbi:Type 1 glutamine amidotransferase-like domain-containing protein [Clostridium culturomicium]|uniref:Type 1 glutamine amidotransferase-like domain-containing protein n=1 Tax=Clostridium culturomicium TaxID=1499683 RepID=UPI0038577530